MMGWAQIAYIALTTLGLGVSLALHGKPRTGSHNFGVALFSAAIPIAILYAGGFFTA